MYVYCSKVNSLDSAVLGSYPTVPPAEKDPDETRPARARKEHSRTNRQPFPTQNQPWKTRDDQVMRWAARQIEMLIFVNMRSVDILNSGA